MALVKCRECKKEVSSSAKMCPNCGAKPKKTSLFTWIVAFVFMAWVISEFNTTPGYVAPPREKTVQEKEDAEYFTRAQMAMAVVQSSAREPESVSFDAVLVSTDKNSACVVYRGKNGFGGVSKGSAVVSLLTGTIDTSSQAVKKKCKDPSMRDMSYMIKYR